MNTTEAIALLKADTRFAPLIEKHGLPDFARGTNVFRALVRSIIYQQLSGKAAATIFARFTALFGGKRFPTPQEVQAMPIRKLRSAGLSLAKAVYVKNLADKFCDGTIKHSSLHRMSNEGIIAHLREVKGIGEWTAHMFLIFTLNRPDVLPTGDLGIRKGFQIVYRLKNPPTHSQMERLAKPWRSHASIASWYLWRAADEAKGAIVRRGT